MTTETDAHARAANYLRSMECHNPEEAVRHVAEILTRRAPTNTSDDDLTPDQWSIVSEAADWGDRKTLADVFQRAGGRVVDLSESTYDGLVAVARWGAIQVVAEKIHV